VVEFDQQKRNRRRPTLELVTTKAGEEEEPVPKKAKPTPAASTVVLFSHCKVECGIPVNYEEFENAFKFHPKAEPPLRSPLENFQPVSPKHVRSRHKVSAAIRDSNLFQRMKAANPSCSQPVKPAPLPGILTEPYIPPASRSFIKEEK
jgi:hypothetical protein